jgi:L,D-transpeptidase catalytic domain
MNNVFYKKAHLFFLAALFFVFSINNAKANAAFFFLPKVEAPIEVQFLIYTEEINAVTKMYDSLHLNAFGLSENAFQYAIAGFENLKEKGKISNDHVISIVDFTRPSSEKRLFVLDVKSYKILFNTYVAHGQGSGQAMATSFSNVPESLQSSLGFYKTSSTYFGKNGFSMKLQGLENGINDKAAERAIVMHGAPYVSEDYINSQGYIGRSWGCPAVPEKLNKPIIEKIKNGSCLFIYSANKNYLQHSKIINS